VSSDALLSSVVIMAVIGAMLLVRFLAGTKAGGRRPAPGAHAVRVPPVPGAAGRLPMRPQPVLGASARPTEPMALTLHRRRRRVTLADARTGIVLATILGACRAHRAEEPW
jgi:hypothetical protein